MRATRVIAGVILAAAAVVAPSRPAQASGNMEQVVNAGTAIADIRWDNRALPIVWRLNNQGVVNNCNNGNPACVGGVSPVTLQDAVDALTFGFDAWQAIPTSRIAFTYGGTTTQTNIGLDGVRLVSWVDATPCNAGVVASTPNTSLTAPLTVSDGNRDVNGDGSIDLDVATYPNGTVLAAGTIIDADMRWCPAGNDYVEMPFDGNATTFDIGAVGTHEIGHFHGVSHSSLVAPVATMLPFVDFTEAYARDVRVLAQDDIASSSRYYPEPGFATGPGRITGRLLLPGTTTGADGVSVTAFDRATGEMTVQVFSVSRFTAGGATPGSFVIDGLPAGTYLVGVEYFDGGSTGSPGFDAWWENNRFNLTIVNSNVSAGPRPPVVRPEFQSAGESSTDDFAEGAPVTVTAGATVDVGTIVINTDAPPAPPGATALALKNGASKEVVFPAGFTFPFFGTSWSRVFVNDNGNITFGEASLPVDSRNFLGPEVTSGLPVPPRIALHMTNLNPEVDNQGQSGGALDAFSRFVSDAAGDRIEVIYLGTPVIDTQKSCTGVIRLFRTGRIEMQFRFWSAWWGVTGISPGGDGTAPRAEIDISRQLPFSGSASQAVFEHFEFVQPSALGGHDLLEDAFDLNGALLVFAPNAAGGYDVSSPHFAGRPAEIGNVRFTGQTALAWDARPEAVTYNVYRGGLGAWTDGNGDGAADDYGACHQPGLIAAAATDGALPPVGGGYFYMVTGRNGMGESPFGPAGSGAARPNASPCP